MAIPRVSLELWKYLDDETIDMMQDEAEGRLPKRQPCYEDEDFFDE